jgi:hypothetical protein
MNALVWRLHRNHAYFATAALGVLVVVFVVTGVLISRAYHDFLSSCSALQNCQDPSQAFGSFGIFSGLAYATIAVPGLIGLFWGAPLLAREFEEGTHVLIWTQGITRRQWMNGKIGSILAASALWGGAMGALVTWWRTPMNAAGVPGVRLQPGLFDMQGIVPIAYAVFAVALGIAVGSIIRRVLPAMAATLMIFVGLRIVIVEYVRRHFLAPVSTLLPVGGGPNSIPRNAGAWILSRTYIGTNGRSVGSRFNLGDVPAACRPGQGGGGGLPACLGAHGWHVLFRYQPASRFWAFQGIEAGIFVALAAALIVIAYRMTLTRDA